MLLEKLQPDMIGLDPEVINTIDKASSEVKATEARTEKEEYE